MLNNDILNSMTVIKTDEKMYLELPDGYRLVYDEDGYVGRYNPNLSEAI